LAHYQRLIPKECQYLLSTEILKPLLVSLCEEHRRLQRSIMGVFLNTNSTNLQYRELEASAEKPTGSEEAKGLTCCHHVTLS
jgi:hypothetical protein